MFYINILHVTNNQQLKNTLVTVCEEKQGGVEIQSLVLNKVRRPQKIVCCRNRSVQQDAPWIK